MANWSSANRMPTSTKEFIFEDQPKTLFPTKMNRLLIEHGEKLIQEHIAKCAVSVTVVEAGELSGSEFVEMRLGNSLV